MHMSRDVAEAIDTRVLPPIFYIIRQVKEEAEPSSPLGLQGVQTEQQKQ